MEPAAAVKSSLKAVVQPAGGGGTAAVAAGASRPEEVSGSSSASALTGRASHLRRLRAVVGVSRVRIDTRKPFSSEIPGLVPGGGATVRALSHQADRIIDIEAFVRKGRFIELPGSALGSCYDQYRRGHFELADAAGIRV
jgi:hypothetical protein